MEAAFAIIVLVALIGAGLWVKLHPNLKDKRETEADVALMGFDPDRSF